MVESILVPFDGSDGSKRALEYVLSTHADGSITVFYVAGSASPMMGEAMGLAIDDDTDNKIEKEANETLEEARAQAADAGVEIKTEIAVGKPGPEIVDHAEQYDLVVVGSHSSSITETFLTGNVTKHVVRDSPVPVTVVN